MRFSTHGVTFEWCAPILKRLTIDPETLAHVVASEVDLTLYTYARPSCADAFKIAHASVTNPNLIGR